MKLVQAFWPHDVQLYVQTLLSMSHSTPKSDDPLSIIPTIKLYFQLDTDRLGGILSYKIKGWSSLA